MTRPTEQEVQEAFRILRADYYSDVEDVALETTRAVKAGEVEDLHDYLHESIDGHRRVFITFQAKCGLLASDNEDAHLDNGPGDVPSVEVQMCYAMEQDVIERIEAEGYDINEPETWGDE